MSLGGAFFGESMFSRARDASKVALVHLVARLRARRLRAARRAVPHRHLARFGAIELPRRQYKRLLAAALERDANFPLEPDPASEAALAEIVGEEVAAAR